MESKSLLSLTLRLIIKAIKMSRNISPKMMTPSDDNNLRAIGVKESSKLPVSILIRYAKGDIIDKTIGPTKDMARIVYRIINSKYALLMNSFNLDFSFSSNLITYDLIPHTINCLYIIWVLRIDL